MIWVGIGIGMILVIFLGWLWAIAPGKGADFSELKQFDYAHRGLHDLKNGVPENSELAFKLAVEHGFGIELDLQLTKDDRVVVHHDGTLKRSCGEEVAVADLTLEELRERFLFGTDQKIPLFSDVLKIMDGKTPMIVELKGYSNHTDKLCTLVMRELQGYTGSYCVESFDPRIVRWFRKNRPEIIRGQLMYHMKKSENGLSAFHAFCARNMLSNFHTRPHFEAYDIRSRNVASLVLAKGLFGMQEVSWTLRTKEQYEQAKALNSLCIFEGFLPVAVPEQAKGNKAAARAGTAALLAEEQK